MKIYHPQLAYIGHCAIFYLPAAKHNIVRLHIHKFLMENYEGYTFESSDICGYWQEGYKDLNTSFNHYDDKNVKYVVSFDGEELIDGFIDFISDLCTRLDEKCIYLTMGKKSYLVYKKES